MAPLATRKASLRALDWLTFFVADIQTGFGPFVAVFLTTRGWTQSDIGLVLTIGGLVALVGQMPGGALVDAMRSPKIAAGVAVLAIALSALALAVLPVFWIVVGSRAVQAAASCVLGPAIAALSLGLVGHAALGERIGRNARFMSIGSGLAAAAMGASGQLVSSQAVFFITAAFAFPALFALRALRTKDLRPAQSAPAARDAGTAGLADLLRNRALLVFAGCVLLFQLANAAMMPLMGGILAVRWGDSATATMAACMIVPQVVVALLAPWVGRVAQDWGRRPFLVAGFAVVAARAAIFAVTQDPHLVIAAQLFDGLSAAVFGIMSTVVVADISRQTGRFNLGLGIVGSAIGIGASASTSIAGLALDHFGAAPTFAGLAVAALLGGLVVIAAMPETREPPAGDPPSTR